MEPFVREMHSTALVGDVSGSLFAVPGARGFNGLSATTSHPHHPLPLPSQLLFEAKSKGVHHQGSYHLGGPLPSPPPHNNDADFQTALEQLSFMGGVQNNSQERSWDLSHSAASVTNSSQPLTGLVGFASTHFDAAVSSPPGSSISQSFGLLHQQRGMMTHGDIHDDLSNTNMKCMATQSNFGACTGATSRIAHILEQRPNVEVSNNMLLLPPTSSMFPSLDCTAPPSSTNVHVYFPGSISPSFLPEATVESAVSGITSHANQDGGCHLVDRPFSMMSSSDGGSLLLERQQQEYYTFDLNEVPGSMQDTTTVAVSSSGQKAKRKYTPKVAKDKRPRKPRVSKVDGQEKKTNAKKVNKKTAVHGHETGANEDVNISAGGGVSGAAAAAVASAVTDSTSLKRNFTKFSSGGAWESPSEGKSCMEFACDDGSNIVSDSSVKRSLFGREEPDEVSFIDHHHHEQQQQQQVAAAAGSVTAVTSAMNNVDDRQVSSVSNFQWEQHSIAANNGSSFLVNQKPFARSEEMGRRVVVRSTELYQQQPFANLSEEMGRQVVVRSTESSYSNTQCHTTFQSYNNGGGGCSSPRTTHTIASQNSSLGFEYGLDEEQLSHSQGRVSSTRRSLMPQFNNSEPTSGARLHHRETYGEGVVASQVQEQQEDKETKKSKLINFVNDCESKNLFFQPETLRAGGGSYRFGDAQNVPEFQQQQQQQKPQESSTVSHFPSEGGALSQRMVVRENCPFTGVDLVSRFDTISNHRVERMISDLSQDTMYNQPECNTRGGAPPPSYHADNHHSASSLVPISKPPFEWHPQGNLQRSNIPRMDPSVNSPCPRELLLPQSVPFQMMDDAQLILYLRDLVTLPGFSFSPMVLLHHVLQHLPDYEKDRFIFLWSHAIQPATATLDMQGCQQQQQQLVIFNPDGTESSVVQQQQQNSNSSSQEVQMMTVQVNSLSPPPHPVEEEGQQPQPPHESTKEEAMPIQQQQPEDEQAGLQIVPYKGKEGGLIPYEGPFLPLRKRKPRPKVVLDTETVRVWKLLMGRGGNPEADSDADKELKWEQERCAMKAQAETFISRMHLVQGDRSFSRWKGSVVDSVVGAFLTQNVSDVLSSSAFMSMRARFPGPSFRGPLKTQAPEDLGEPVEKICAEMPMKESDSTTTPSSMNHQEQQQQQQQLSYGAQEMLVNGDIDKNSKNQFSGGGAVPHPDNLMSDHHEQKNLLEGENMPQPMMMMGCATGEDASVAAALNSLSSQGYQESNNPALGCQEVEEQVVSCLQQAVEVGGLLELGEKLDLVHNSQQQAQQLIPPVLDKKSVSISVGSSFIDGKENGLMLQNATAATDAANIQENSLESSSAVCINAQLDLLSLQPVDQSETRELVTAEGGDQLLLKSKYNPKGLTGADRARLEESQVSARNPFDWEGLRGQFQVKCETVEEDGSRTEAAMPAPRTFMNEDGVDWEAVRLADVEVVAGVIKERGLNWILAGRIKAFLERIRREHGAIDLEWLRSLPTDDTKEFLLSVRGLGLKSVECIRLLTLHHLAFPVDTNVGRICVRLGWVPLEPLPEELQLHLLELYPVQATIQKYLWPRLCTLDQETLYELHYQMITFGKVFCTKSKPNCNACPMKAECKHFASALSSARQALPAPEKASANPTLLALPQGTTSTVTQAAGATEGDKSLLIQSTNVGSSQDCCEPIIEEPMTPPEESDDIATDNPKPDHLPEETTIMTVVEMQVDSSETCLQNPPASSSSQVIIPDALSQELVLLPPEAASIPVPKLKNVGRLRTVHYVYELPDHHPLLEGMDERETDDPCCYLLAIWSPGEVPSSIPNLDDCNHEENPFASSSFADDSDSIKGTLLVPCRTAMQGSFPLNGTYFQVNEVFADHASSLQPIVVPRTLLWNLRRRFVFFGTSVTSIFRGMTTPEIQACFWRGYVCVRGFDRTSRAPKPLATRLHLQATKSPNKGAAMETND
ncbi:unnamed protein product [Sphagnum troendelagicum]|uniref:HhH-GPD domain-containing protein n=1 Tax=Sphagnum troendelagicum TaxID=128251 RepID=A0ABP0V4K6_9BRYO